ncbi:MAG: L-lactate permease [Nitrospirota bacterium]
MNAAPPVTSLTWLAAFLPILVLLVLLVWRRWSTSAAAPLALAGAVAAALLFYRTPLHTLAVAAGKGIWDAIFVLYVIWPALILYNVAHEAGAFGAMQRGLRHLIPDRLLVVLAFAWVLASFIQSIAGFGTNLAVTTPLLIGLGVQPVYAVLLPMIGAAWANMFGSLGTAWLATQTVVDIPDTTVILRYAAALIWVPNLMAGIAIAWFYGKTWALKRGGPAIVALSLIQGGLQFLLVPIIPTIGTFLATSASLGALFILNRWGFYRQQDRDEPHLIFTESGKRAFYEENKEREAKLSVKPTEPSPTPGPRERPGMSLALAFAPYAVLAVLAVTALLIPPVNHILEQFRVGLPFPDATTGFGVEQKAVDAYAAFTPLTHPGTLLLLSATAGYLLYRKRGLYGKEDTPAALLSLAAEDALPATTAIAALLLISKVMDHSGETTVLALGIAQVSSPAVYAGASDFIGILGSLVTSSNTASNVLFAPLQATAARAQELSVNLILAAQSAGGAVGNAMAPGDALLGATVAGLSGRIGAVLARALPWTLITGALVSAFTLGIYFLM